jgi:hypothetical protein
VEQLDHEGTGAVVKNYNANCDVLAEARVFDVARIPQTCWHFLRQLRYISGIPCE